MKIGSRDSFWVLVGLLSLLVMLCTVGCNLGMGPPTGPDPPELTEPNELYLHNRLQCNALYHQLGYDIEIWWVPRRFVTLPDGRLGWIGCSASPGADFVRCDQKWVNAETTTRLVLNEVAAHETCHISGDMREPPEACMILALERCRE